MGMAGAMMAAAAAGGPMMQAPPPHAAHMHHPAALGQAAAYAQQHQQMQAMMQQAQQIPPSLPNTNNPRFFFDISMEGKRLGRVIIEVRQTESDCSPPRSIRSLLQTVKVKRPKYNFSQKKSINK